MSARDDDFSVPVKHVLSRRVGQRCSNPECRRSTTGPQDDPSKAVNIGVASHITAAAAGGPRYDASLTPEERRSAENGIWLCQTHAKLIDNDETRYTVDVVRGWKRQAEEAAIRDLEGRGEPSVATPFPRLERLIPDLLEEMRKDLRDDPFTREFVLLTDGVIFNSNHAYFRYSLSADPALSGKVQMLENLGLVNRLPSRNVTRYVIGEELAEYLAG